MCPRSTSLAWFSAVSWSDPGDVPDGLIVAASEVQNADNLGPVGSRRPTCTAGRYRSFFEQDSETVTGSKNSPLSTALYPDSDLIVIKMLPLTDQSR